MVMTEMEVWWIYEYNLPQWPWFWKINYNWHYGFIVTGWFAMDTDQFDIELYMYI